jgi:hypothetical protein
LCGVVAAGKRRKSPGRRVPADAGSIGGNGTSKTLPATSGKRSEISWNGCRHEVKTASAAFTLAVMFRWLGRSSNAEENTRRSCTVTNRRLPKARTRWYGK